MKIRLLVAFTILVILIAILLRPILQDPSYHFFADTRDFFRIPNFLNVFSNLPFIIIGIYGVMLVFESSVKSIAPMYYSLFTGIMLIGFGSAYYHLQPNNERLVWDRIPMTIVFMAFQSATVAECIDVKISKLLFIPLITVGILSVLWWHYTERFGTGDLRFYGAVQFYPVGFILMTLILFPSNTDKRVMHLFAWVVIWYVVAKLFEHFDESVFYHTALVSGHSLKHLAAAVSTGFMVRIFKVKYNSKYLI